MVLTSSAIVLGIKGTLNHLATVISIKLQVAPESTKPHRVNLFSCEEILACTKKCFEAQDSGVKAIGKDTGSFLAPEVLVSIVLRCVSLTTHFFS